MERVTIRRAAAAGRRSPAFAVALSCGLALVVIVGQAALRAVVQHHGDVGLVAIPSANRVGHHDVNRAGTSLAAVDPATEQAAPGPGTTGTIAPPPEPAGLPPLVEPATVVAARPFVMGRATALDRGRALECLTDAVYHEAGNQSDDGERAVAQVVLNRVRHPVFPASVCGVVFQGSEHDGCQFSFACDGSMTRPTSRTGWARAMRIAADALAGQVYAPVGLATHYHSYAVAPTWSRALVMTNAVGAHFFHRWKGYWGTPAAFSQSWMGHEPSPGPHPRIDDEAAPLPVDAVARTAALSPPVAGPASAPPLHIDEASPAANVTVTTLPSSPALDRWKDSGKPLR